MDMFNRFKQIHFYHESSKYMYVSSKSPSFIDGDEAVEVMLHGACTNLTMPMIIQSYRVGILFLYFVEYIYIDPSSLFSDSE